MTADPGEVQRGLDVSVSVAFDEPVFLEASPGRERDIRITLRGPVSAGEEIVGDWNGSRDAPDSAVLHDVAVIDDRTLTVVITLATDAAVGTNRLAVVADSAGSCAGPHGEAELVVR